MVVKEGNAQKPVHDASHRHSCLRSYAWNMEYDGVGIIKCWYSPVWRRRLQATRGDADACPECRLYSLPTTLPFLATSPSFLYYLVYVLTAFYLFTSY